MTSNDELYASEPTSPLPQQLHRQQANYYGAERLIIVSQRRALFDKREAHYENNNLDDELWQSFANHR